MKRSPNQPNQNPNQSLIDRRNLIARKMCLLLKVKRPVPTRSIKLCTKNLVLKIGQRNFINYFKATVNVRNLIQKIENHPQRRTFQSDLQQHRQFNPYSKESRDVIKAVGNTELCELLDVEPKARCKACLSYWDVGIVYCTCGHFLRDDTTENKKYIKAVLDFFSIPNFTSGKVNPTVTAAGANQLKKKCKKREFSSIHDRFIRDVRFRKTMIELGRTEEVIRDMDK